jgi:hypothetical protein
MLGALDVGSICGPGIPISILFTCTFVAVAFIFWNFLEHMKYIIRIIRMNTKPPTLPPMIAPIGRSVPSGKQKLIFYNVSIPKTQVWVFIMIFSFHINNTFEAKDI